MASLKIHSNTKKTMKKITEGQNVMELNTIISR